VHVETGEKKLTRRLLNGNPIFKGFVEEEK
jgi:hypothetical protein